MDNLTIEKKKRIGVLFGGKSSEKEVSLATGRYILNLIDASQYESVALYMDYCGKIWRIPPSLVIKNTTKDVQDSLDSSGERLKFENLSDLIDCVFIALLGKYGEDGCIQGVFELIGIPYTGSGILASSVAMHKRVHKRLLESEGFKVAKDIIILRSEYSQNSDQAYWVNKIETDIGFPAIIKPVMEGSSVGVSYIKSGNDLSSALDNAFEWDDEIIVEQYISGQEFMCVVIGNNDPIAFDPSEVEFDGDIFTYEAKYMPGQARYYTPIRTSKGKIKEIQQIAVDIYKLFWIKGYGRVDGFLKNGKDIYISEPHTGTIMVPSSYVFQQASLHDISIKSGKVGKLNPRLFISKIIDYCLEAHDGKKGCL